MKILHTADWHLGNTFHGHSREEEHRHFLRWLLTTLRTEQPDALIVAGDVFDSANPSASAETLFYDFLLQAGETVSGLQIVVIAGNHDSAGRLEAPAALLRRHNIYVRAVIRRHPDNGQPDYSHYLLPLSSRTSPEAEVVCFALPFLRSCDYPAGLSPEQGIHLYLSHLTKALRASDFRGLPVVVTAHFYAAGAEVVEQEHSERLVIGGQEAVSAEVAECGAVYTALGHIHRAQRIPLRKGKGEMWYAGSVLPMSFTERSYRHGIQRILIDADGTAAVSRIDYAPLRGLIAIPTSGAGSPVEVLDAIAALPRREKRDDGAHWPYLEIRVAERQPLPTLMADVAEALSDRAVRFCRMVRELPVSQQAGPIGERLETLQSLTPEEMAQRIFRSRYADAMPEPLLTRFRQAMSEALDEQAAAPAETEENRNPPLVP